MLLRQDHEHYGILALQMLGAPQQANKRLHATCSFGCEASFECGRKLTGWLGPAVAVLCAVHTSVLALLMVAVEPADARHEASAD